MTDRPEAREGAPYWSLAGLAEGVRLIAPLVPGTCVFAAAVGTIAAQKGLSVVEVGAMSFFTYAGTSQLLALEVWPQQWTFGAIATIALVTLTVNMRFVLMSAAFRPWLGPLPAWQAYPALFFVTDANWLAGMRYRAGGGADVSAYLGGGLIMWATWVPSTIIGHQLGRFVSDPKRFGLDLMLPVFFTAILVPLWRGPRRAIGWALGGAVALVTSWLVPGWWFIVTGAIAGSVAGGFLDDRP